MRQRVMMRAGRRVRPRVSFEGQIELFHDGERLDPSGSADLSEGGLCLRQLQVPLHSPVKVFIALPDASGSGETQTVMLDGEVAWRKLSKCGVRFVASPPPVLRHYVQQQLAC